MLLGVAHEFDLIVEYRLASVRLHLLREEAGVGVLHLVEGEILIRIESSMEIPLILCRLELRQGSRINLKIAGVGDLKLRT